MLIETGCLGSGVDEVHDELRDVQSRGGDDAGASWRGDVSSLLGEAVPAPRQPALGTLRTTFVGVARGVVPSGSFTRSSVVAGSGPPEPLFAGVWVSWWFLTTPPHHEWKPGGVVRNQSRQKRGCGMGLRRTVEKGQNKGMENER